jgi:hypothetical protein
VYVLFLLPQLPHRTNVIRAFLRSLLLPVPAELALITHLPGIHDDRALCCLLSEALTSTAPVPVQHT